MTNRKAFTLIELMVVIIILGIMSTIAYLSTTKLQTSAETQTSLDRLVASIKTQHMYAMLGNSATHLKAMSRGVYFEEGSNIFVLFDCDELQDCTYKQERNTNVVDSIEKSLIFGRVSLPGHQIVFSPLSGEVANFQSGLSTIMIDNIVDRSTTTLHITSVGTLEISP